MKKRWISLLLALALVCTVLPAAVPTARADTATHTLEGYTAVYTFDFESWEDHSAWWTTDEDGDGYIWDNEEGDGMGYNNSKCIYSESFINDVGPLDPDNWLYSPEFYIEDGSMFSFLLKAQDETVRGDTVGVYVCTGTISEAGNNMRGELIADYYADDEWTEYSFDLSAYAGETVRIGFRHYNSYDHFRVNLDCFTLWQLYYEPNTGIGKHSDWAGEELTDAYMADMIPICLLDVDLTRSITRAEFAAVAVKLYEGISGKSAPYVSESPFYDTSDEAVLQASALGIVNGVGEGKFDPNGLLTREQASTMMGRAYLEGIGEEEIWFETPTPYRDDYKISDWARDAVYFMTAYGVLGGMGDGRFAPKSNATREQGICIALRALEQLP